MPGLPLAIVRPDAQVTLIESTRKKADFLTDAVHQMQLRNVKVANARAEELARGPARESFDVVTARAVGALDLLAEWCLPLTKKGGKLLAMKGQRIAEELPAAARAIRILGGGGSPFCLTFGPNGVLYAGGDFGSMGGVANTGGIAQWSGTGSRR